MNNPQLNTGDTFLRISKYGHVFGIVKEIHSQAIISTTHGCSYILTKIIATTGIAYDGNECYKVTKQYNPDEITKIIENSKKPINWLETLKQIKFPH